MVAHGSHAKLDGEYCWGVAFGNLGATARIGSAPAPPSPTDEELTAAVKYQVGHPDNEWD